MMLDGRLLGQFLAEEEVRGESHMAPTLLQGERTSCRAAPWQEMGGRKERKRGKGRYADKGARDGL